MIVLKVRDFKNILSKIAIFLDTPLLKSGMASQEFEGRPMKMLIASLCQILCKKSLIGPQGIGSKVANKS